MHASPPASTSSRPDTPGSLCSRMPEPPTGSPTPESLSPTPDALEAPPGGRLRSLRWEPVAVVAALGLGGAFLLNRLRPPASLRQSLLRYLISQVPVVLYIASSYLAVRMIENVMDDTGFNPFEFGQLSHFRMSHEEEQDRRRRLGIAENHHNLPSIYIAAWLKNTGSTQFPDASLRAAALAASHPCYAPGLVAACRQFQWYSQPLQGARACHSRDAVYGAPPDEPAFAFHVLTRQVHEPGFLLPLDQLRCSDVLVLMVVVPMEGMREGVMMTAIQRGPHDFFLLFNPDQGLSVTASESLLQNTVREDMADVRAVRLDLIRLRERELPAERPWYSRYGSAV